MLLCTVCGTFEAMEMFSQPASQLSGAIHIRLRWLSLFSLQVSPWLKTTLQWDSKREKRASSSYVFLSLHTAYIWSHISGCFLAHASRPREASPSILIYHHPCFPGPYQHLSLRDRSSAGIHFDVPPRPELAHAPLDSVVIETTFSNLSRHGLYLLGCYCAANKLSTGGRCCEFRLFAGPVYSTQI